jgi:hypothetical protein
VSYLGLDFGSPGCKAAFARQHGIDYSTFRGWRHRWTKTTPSPALVEVELQGVATVVHLLIEVPYCDGTGACVLAKGLAKSVCLPPQSAGPADAGLRLSSQALPLLLDRAELGQRRSPNLKLRPRECRVARFSPETSALCRIKIQT